MVARPPDNRGKEKSPETLPPLLARIIRREQELEETVAEGRRRARHKVGEAQREAADVVERARSEAEKEAKELLEATEGEARAESRRIVDAAREEARHLPRLMEERAEALAAALLPMILPGPPGDGEP